MPKKIRLEKFISDSKNISRSEIKKLLAKKRIQVNGQTVTKSMQISTQDTVQIDSETLIYSEFSYFMLNKPSGYITANEDKNQPTVFNLLNLKKTQYFAYGRLDKDTTGLLLISNDGKLGHKLLSSKNHIPKTYLVTCNKNIDDSIYQFSGPIKLNKDEIITEYIFKKVDDNSCLLTIYSGLFHQVKRMMGFFDLEVINLKRISFGPLNLDENLSEGSYRKLTDQEIKKLQNA